MKYKEERLSSYELLRIIAILFIIGYHFYYHILDSSTFSPGTIDNLQELLHHPVPEGSLYQILTSYSSIFGKKIFVMDVFVNFGGQVGNMLFMMLTGFFLYDKELSLEKALSKIKYLGATVFYYFVIIFVILIPFQIQEIESKNFFFYFGGFNPFQLTNSVWYLRYYIAMLFLILIVGKWLRSLNRKKHQVLLMFLFAIQLLNPPTVSIFGLKLDVEFFTFVLMFVFGGYLKQYDPSKEISKLKIVIMIIACFGIFGLIDFVQRNGVSLNRLYDYSFSSKTNVLTLTITVLIFILFTKIKLKNNKLINLISSTTLGIYIFHEGCPQIREVKYFLIDYLFKGQWNINTLFWGGMMSIVFWFSLGFIIDIARQLFFKMKPIKNLLQ